MEVVSDASALLAVVLGEPERVQIVAATEDAKLAAPPALPFEVGNALIALLKRGRIDEESVAAAWRAAQSIPVQLVAIDMEAALRIATVHGVYAYDAYYLQCALSMQRPLLTLDRKMRMLASDLGIAQVLDP